MEQDITLTVGMLLIRYERYEVVIRSRRVPLTAVEFRLLWRLASQPGRIHPPHALAGEIGDDQKVEHVVRMRISKLRRKLGEARGQLKTYRGEGYSLEPE